MCDFVYCPCDLLRQVRCENRRVYGYNSSAFALPYDGYSFGKIRFKFDLSYGLYLYHMVVVDIFVQIGLVGNMGYVAAVYVIAVLCALISHYLVDDTVAHIFNKKKSSIDEVKEEEKIKEKQIVKQPVSVADDDETDF